MSFNDILILSAVEVFGDFNLRWYAETNAPSYLGFGLIGYAAVVVWLIKRFRSGNVLYVNAMWDSASTLIESAAAYYILGDRLKTPKQYAGLALVIVGMYLLRDYSR